MKKEDFFGDDSEIQISKELIVKLLQHYFPLLLAELYRQSLARGVEANKMIIIDFLKSTFCCKQSEEIAEIIKFNNATLIRQKFRAFIERKRNIT